MNVGILHRPRSCKSAETSTDLPRIFTCDGMRLGIHAQVFRESLALAHEQAICLLFPFVLSKHYTHCIIASVNCCNRREYICLIHIATIQPDHSCQHVAQRRYAKLICAAETLSLQANASLLV